MDLEQALQHRAEVEEFRRKHRTSLLTLVFTDIVGSTALKQGLGEREAASLFQDYHELVRMSSDGSANGGGQEASFAALQGQGPV